MIHVAIIDTRGSWPIAQAAHAALRQAVAALMAACVLHVAVTTAAELPTKEPMRASPIRAGDLAPEFTLPDQYGRPHTLSSERGRHAVVLVFYRGHW